MRDQKSLLRNELRLDELFAWQALLFVETLDEDVANGNNLATADVIQTPHAQVLCQVFARNRQFRGT